MGKRSNFPRIPRDFYRTPLEAVCPLLPHLNPATRFHEPCAGDGRLVDHLTGFGHLLSGVSDIEPRQDWIMTDCATSVVAGDDTDLFITNPPWDRSILHPIIENLSNQRPTWLLFDADWMHTKQSAAFLPRLRSIVSVGRVKWIPDSKMTGKDNCCWYLFDKPLAFRNIRFHGRVPS